MNLLLLYPEDFTSKFEATITGRRFEHLKKIIKIECGQSIATGLLNGKTGSGKITTIGENYITLFVQLEKSPPPAISITLILALPRPLMLKRILQTVTTIGVKQIHLINSQRVEKSYWSSSDLDEKVIYHQLILGLEQSRDTVLPQLHFHRHFKTFIEKNLADIASNKQALLADIGDHPPCPGNVQQPAVLAIGPEGGFLPDEVTHFINKGFTAVQLGQRPLRVETAVTALLGRLLSL